MATWGAEDGYANAQRQADQAARRAAAQAEDARRAQAAAQAGRNSRKV